jgi:hypothetical protein
MVHTRLISSLAVRVLNLFMLFYLLTISLESMCPYEYGTVQREKPALSLVSSPLLTHPEKPATFHIRLANLAWRNGSIYALSVNPVGLEDDAEV